jgi:fibronectin-binding autotransporter adhesin
MKAAILSLAIFSVPTLAQIAPTEANLRAAVASGGTIRFSSSGVIPITAPIAVSIDTVIDGAVNPVTLDGQAATNIFVVGSGVHLSLTNMTFANGAAIQPENPGLGSAPPAKGGAIQNDGGIVVVVNCIFTNNLARGADGNTSFGLPSRGIGGPALGGAIWQSAGALSIQGGSFINNLALGGKTGSFTPFATRGGAICADNGILEIVNASFSGNLANGAVASSNPLDAGPATASGGAIALGSGTLDVMNTRFASNSAAGTLGFGRGGAVSIDGGSAMIGNSHFIANSAVAGGRLNRATPIPPGDGAGLFIGPGAEVAVSGCTFEKGISVGYFYDLNNIGPGRGGGIFNSGGATIVNSTLFGNAAQIQFGNFYTRQATLGAAIYNDGTIGLTNVTVAANTSGQPILYSANGSFTLKNCLLGENNGVTATNVVDAGNNLSATDSPLFTATSSHNNFDLRLGPLGDYGGPTPTISLLAGSPAIDAAEDATAPATDQRGRARPYGAHSDVGAFESSAPFTIVGTVLGYRDPSATVTDGATPIPVDANGNFRLVLPAGPTTLTFHAANSLFDPPSFSSNLAVDTLAKTVGFPVHGFGFNPTSEPATFGFAGRSGETWRFDVSSDLMQWTPVRTNTFASDSVFSLPVTNDPSTCFKAIKL